MKLDTGQKSVYKIHDVLLYKPEHALTIIDNKFMLIKKEVHQLLFTFPGGLL